jgi:glycosyltransferase involved in cell wall biosynthesis
MVFAEANAFGVPCITRRVGGIPSIIRDDVNGRMFNPDSPARQYAQYVAGVFADRARYRELAHTSRVEYTSRLNWGIAAAQVRDVLAAVTTTNTTPG